LSSVSLLLNVRCLFFASIGPGAVFPKEQGGRFSLQAHRRGGAMILKGRRFCRSRARGTLDRRGFRRDKAFHENGTLHYLPEHYSLAAQLAWPFSSPEIPR
jgi:hypothetical protein